MTSKLVRKLCYEYIWYVNITKAIIFQFSIHITSVVLAILAKFYCFTSPFVPNLEAKSVVPATITRNSEHCWRSLECLYRFSLSGYTHCRDVIMNAMASQITGVSIVYSTICAGAYQRKHQSSASLPFVGGIHRWPANYPHEGPVTRRMFPFDDVIISCCCIKVARVPMWEMSCIL